MFLGFLVVCFLNVVLPLSSYVQFYFVKYKMNRR